MSAQPSLPEPPSSRLRGFVYVAVALLLVAGVVLVKQHDEIQSLKMQLVSLAGMCPADIYPRDYDHCGADNTPVCGQAAWFGTSTKGKCRVTEVKTGTGCGICYAGQVSPCLLSDYPKGCDGQSNLCGVRYCIQTSTGAYDWEDLCRVVN